MGKGPTAVVATEAGEKVGTSMGIGEEDWAGLVIICPAIIIGVSSTGAADLRLRAMGSIGKGGGKG
jgi:hypothetical protein